MIITKEVVLIDGKVLRSPPNHRWERGADDVWRSGRDSMSAEEMGLKLALSGQDSACSVAESWVLLPG